MVDMVNINSNKPNSTKQSTNILYINTKLVTKDLLKSRSVTDIASIKLSSQDYDNESKNLIQEKLIILSFQKVYILCNRN